MKTKILLPALLSILFATIGYAQKGYTPTAGGEFGIGLRLGGGSGLSLKKYHRSNLSAFELIGGYSFDEEIEDTYGTCCSKNWGE